MNIKYKDFEKHLKNVVKIVEFENKLWKLMRESYDNCIDCELNYPTLIDDVVDLLSIATADKSEWISYWVFELDCGKKYKDGMITASDGSIIKLASIKDLWELLSEENKQ